VVGGAPSFPAGGARRPAPLSLLFHVEHPLPHPVLYFDHNATAPLSPAARAAWLEAQELFPGNPASTHRAGRRAEAALEASRARLAGWLGCADGDIVFTSGATEAANAVFAHLAHTAPAGAGGRAELLVSAVEHPCVLAAAERWFPSRVVRLPVLPDGVLDFDAAAGLLGAGPRAVRPAAVALMAANNETGVLQPWAALRDLCRERDIPFVCDATQWVGRLPAEGLGGCAFLFASGHKSGAPVGTGFLKVPPGFTGLFSGGGQEDGRRAGTQDVAGAAGLVAALRECEGLLPGVPAKLEMRAEAERLLLDALPGGRIVGAGAERLWNTVSLLAPELADCRQRWVVRLDAAGVAASSGSACAAGREQASHVLRAMGAGPGESDRVVRLSSGWGTGVEEWRGVAERMGAVFERWR